MDDRVYGVRHHGHDEARKKEDEMSWERSSPGCIHRVFRNDVDLVKTDDEWSINHDRQEQDERRKGDVSGCGHAPTSIRVHLDRCDSQSSQDETNVHDSSLKVLCRSLRIFRFLSTRATYLRISFLKVLRYRLCQNLLQLLSFKVIT